MLMEYLKSPKVRAALVTVAVTIFLVVWTSVTGSPPPAPVLDAIEEHSDVGIDCDDAGNCSVVVSEGSGEAEDVEEPASGSGEGSGQ